jgi:hypothetical protein
MKLFSKFVIASLALALALITAANAQTMRASVPFGFQAGGKILPAGVYNVALSHGSHRIVLSQLNGYAGCTLPIKTYAGPATPGDGKLIFSQYGDSYFLTHVDVSGTDSGVDLFTSHAERELAKTQPKGKQVVLQAAAY